MVFMRYSNFNHDILIKRIDKKYEGEKIENKISLFCKECKLKPYRFKRVIEGYGYFQTDEIYRMVNILDLKKNDIVDYFFNVV